MHATMNEPTNETMNAKAYVVSASDYDRLKDLVQSPRYRATHSTLVSALERELNRSEVVSPTSVPAGVVTMNSQVQVRDLAGRARETHTLVYPDAADIDAGRISVLAPLGSALLGAKAGDVVTCETPGGVRRLKVERIIYQPEAAGDFHL